MAEEKKNVFTKEGYEDLQNELAYRRTELKSEISRRLEEARAQGDLSENSEYDDAKDAQAKNEARIHEIEELLKNSVVQDDSEISTTKVTIGSKVTLQDTATKNEYEYTIVGQSEVDFFKNRISEESPVGSAIMGKKKGSTVTVTTPGGQSKYKIIKIGK